MAGRVTATQSKMESMDGAARKDDTMTELTKKSVNHAELHATEATKQVEAAMKAVKDIIEELNSLRDIKEDDLDDLGEWRGRRNKRGRRNILIYFQLTSSDRRLAEAEQDLTVANLSMRMDTLSSFKTYHNNLLKEHQMSILHLEQEVSTIKAIAESLPQDCFKRTRLEPI